MSVKYIAWFVVTAILSSLLHYLTIVYVPRQKMAFIRNRVIKMVGGTNKVLLGPKVTAEVKLVRVNPDMIFSLVPYDLSSGPLLVTTPIPDFYFSLSIYSSNTDNFYVVNGERVTTSNLDFILAKSDFKGADQAEVIRSPSNTGLILLRYFAENVEVCDVFRRQLSVKVLSQKQN